ncbi:MAG: DUF4012 domain-containing protein [Marmoricola sp.]
MGISPGFKLSRRHVVVALSLIAFFVIGVFAWQAWSASRALLDARTHAESVQKRVKAGDFDGANRALAELRANTSKAHDSTDGVLWDMGKHIPFIGRDIGAVQTVSEVLDTATKVNAPIALDLSRAVDGGVFRPNKGQLDLAEIQKLTPKVNRAATSIEKAGADLDGIRSGKLVFPFNDLVGDLKDEVERARAASTATATAFDLMPQMLGQDEPRDYLLIIQNPAELRATGGLPGSLAVLHADKGKVTMGWQGSAGDVNPFSAPVVTLPKDTLQQYGPTMATDFRDLNFTPDFPEAAQIATAMVEQKLKIKVDGVVSVDPLALAGLMQGTGPINAGHGIVLTANNVVPVLLNQTYQSIQDAAAQDTFFQNVARKIFDAVITGQGSQQLAITGLANATNQHRVQLWSNRDDEESRLTGTAVGGALGGQSGRTPQVGMYINDSTAGKMDYYLQYRSSVAAVDCRRHGAQDLRASVAFTSTMPKDYQRLSEFVTGTGAFAPKGTIAFNLRFYAPYGGEIVGLTVNGKPNSATADLHHGRQVAFLPVALKPQEQVIVTADIRTAPGQDGDGVYSFTPGMVPAQNGVRFASACD